MAPGDPAGGQRPVAAGRLGHVPALDGLRAVALLGVLAFHQGFPSAGGGFLGVSSFFTLSGFLIGRLALDERAATGRLDLARFWERRARRLLPAALVTLALVVVLQATLEIGSGPTFRGDLLAALAYVANWRFAATSGDYALLFADPSPVLHMWSLAIEEQFYLLFPLLFAGLARWGRRGVAAGCAGLGVASFLSAAGAAGSAGNGGLVYYATYTRAGEIFAGVVLACLTTTGPVRRLLAVPSARRVTVLRWAGPVAFAGLAWLWRSTSLATPALFRGLTALNAALTVVVIVAVITPGTAGRHPLRTLLGAAPLRALGTVSYGAYLLHWPLFLVLTAERVHVDDVRLLFLVRLAATIAAAALCYVAVEAPVRFGLRLPRPRLAAGFAVGAASVALLAAVVPVHRGTGFGLVDAHRAGDTWAVPASTPGAPRLLLLGDSVAWSFGPAFQAWNDDHPEAEVDVEAHTAFACPIGGTDPPLRAFGRAWSPTGDCRRYHAGLAGAVADTDAEAIVFTSGVFEMGERLFAGDWYHVGDGVYDAWLAGRLAELVDVLAAAGRPVLWMTHPHIRITTEDGGAQRRWQDVTMNEPARIDRFNELVRQAVGDRPGFTFVDLAGWTSALPGGEFDPQWRDGVHYTWSAAEALGRWLVPQVVAAARPPA